VLGNIWESTGLHLIAGLFTLKEIGNMKFRFRSCVLGAVMLFGLGSAVLAQDETLTNGEIISLAKAGLSQSLIIGKIRTSKSSFDLSTNGLISLKQAGVSDAIVAAMMEAKSGRSITAPAAAAEAGDPNDPMSKHSYGIYLYEEAGGERRMTQVKPSVSAQNRTGGTFTSGLTYGITKVKTKANLPGRNSAAFRRTPKSSRLSASTNAATIAR
jgi:hypothetical protein